MQCHDMFTFLKTWLEKEPRGSANVNPLTQRALGARARGWEGGCGASRTLSPAATMSETLRARSNQMHSVLYVFFHIRCRGKFFH